MILTNFNHLATSELLNTVESITTSSVNPHQIVIDITGAPALFIERVGNIVIIAVSPSPRVALRHTAPPRLNVMEPLVATFVKSSEETPTGARGPDVIPLKQSKQH